MQPRKEHGLRSDKQGPGVPTRCHRCGSLMVSQRFYGHQEVFWGQRCIACGDIVDPIILENRSSMMGRPLRRP